MSVFTNACLFYGIVSNGETKALFDFIEDLEDDHFDGIQQDIQKKHNIRLKRYFGDAEVYAITAYRNYASDKVFDIQEIAFDEINAIESYQRNIIAFLTELNVENPTQYEPHWYLMTYID